MIYTLGWNGIKNHKKLHVSKNGASNLDKPSYPKKIRLRILGLISDLQLKCDQLLKDYPWLNSVQTSVQILDQSIQYSNENFNTKEFNFIDLGRYDVSSSVWSWSWIDDDNNYIIDSVSMKFKDYGSKKDIEILTKGKWQTLEDEKIEVVALCARLIGSIGLEIQVEGDIERYYLLL